MDIRSDKRKTQKPARDRVNGGGKLEHEQMENRKKGNAKENQRRDLETRLFDRFRSAPGNKNMRSRFHTLRHQTIGSLDQTAETEVLLDDDIVHCCHHESNLGGISSAGEVRVDLLLLGLVQGNESVEDVVASRGVVGTALVIREVVLHRANGELLLEAIDLVEEENDRGLDEPPGVADRVE